MSDENMTAEEAEANFLAHLVTPVQLLPALEHLASAVDAHGVPKEQASTFIWGPMGIGKTDIVRQLGKYWGMRCVALHLPQFDPTDLKGIPVREPDGRVVWVPSSYLPQTSTVQITKDYKGGPISFDFPSAEDVMVHITDRDGKTVCRFNDQMQGDLNEAKLDCAINMIERVVTINGNFSKLLGGTIRLTDKAILFLDELSAAVPEVQNAALQLCLDRRIGEYDVPPFTPLIAAGNRETDMAYVHQLSAPLANRFVHLRLTHSFEDWLQWALINRIHPEILGYLQFRKDRLFIFNKNVEARMAQGDCGFPTPRSWAKLSDQLTDTLASGIINAVITGFVGCAVGNEFIAHRAVCDQLPSPDDILQGKKIDISDDLDVGARYALATSLCYALEDYHGKYFVEEHEGDMKKQPKDWQVAAEAFCDFVDNHLGREMTVMCVHLVAKHLQISFTRLKDLDDEDFDEFAEKYREILRKTI